jgi:hypothetical protein
VYFKDQFQAALSSRLLDKINDATPHLLVGDPHERPGQGQSFRCCDEVHKGVERGAPSKKSFSSVSSPILACSDFTSTAGGAMAWPPPGPNTSAASPSSCAFHDVT